MPKFQVTNPDGHVLEIEAPEGATAQDAISYAQQNYRPQEAAKPGYLEDIAKSAAYRGIPDGVAASTIGGLSLNGIRLVSDAARWAGGKAYKAIEGEELPHYTPNPVPTSHDVLQGLSRATIGKDLYEPKTIPGQYANTTAQFAGGGLASGVPLSSSIPSAVVSETAGQLTKDTPYEGPARVLSAALTPVAISGGNRALSAAKNKPQSYTSEEIKTQSSQAYQKADAIGGQLSPSFTDKFLNEIQSASPQTNAGKVLAGETPVTALIERAKGLAGKPLSLAEVQEIDEHLGDVIDGLLKSGSNKQASKVMEVQSTFRNMIEDADQASVVGGKAGFDALKEGRKKWSQQARLKDIEKIITRAEMTQNPATAIKTGFKNLVTNEKRIRGFSQEQKKAIGKAAESGKLDDILGIFGSRLSPIVAGITGGPLSGIATQATSMAARGMKDRIQIGRAQKIADMIAGQKPNSPSQIPNQSNLSLPLLLGQGMRPSNAAELYGKLLMSGQ